MLAERRAGLRHARALRAALDGTGLRLLLHAPDDLSAGTPEHDRAFDGLLDYAAAAGAELVAYHGLNFAEADGPAAARLRERAQLEERSLIPLLQRAHSLGVTVAIENLAPVYAPPTSAAGRTTRSRCATSCAASTSRRPGCCSTSGTCTSPPTRRAPTTRRVLAACAPRRRAVPRARQPRLPPGDRRARASTRSSSTCTCRPAAARCRGRGSPGMVAAHDAPVMLEVERSHRPALEVLAARTRRGSWRSTAPPPRPPDAPGRCGPAPAVRQDGGVTIVPLTSLSHGAGCGCKLPAAALLPIVRDLPAQPTTRGCSWAARPATTPPSTASLTTSRSSRRSTSSRRSSTTRTTSAGSRRRTRCPTSTRWAAGRSRR